MTRHRLFYITPITSQRIEAVINWLDLEKREFGITYIEGKGYRGAHNVLDMDNKESYELVEV